MGDVHPCCVATLKHQSGSSCCFYFSIMFKATMKTNGFSENMLLPKKMMVHHNESGKIIGENQHHWKPSIVLVHRILFPSWLVMNSQLWSIPHTSILFHCQTHPNMHSSRSRLNIACSIVFHLIYVVCISIYIYTPLSSIIIISL